MNSEAVIKEFEKDIRAMLKDIGRVSDKYLNSLVIDGQKNVLFSPENIQLSGEMDAELQRITQKYGKIFERYGKRMIILSKSIMSDFEGMGTKQQLDRSMERVQQMLERVGIQPNGTISPSSFLGTFINAEPLRLEIRKFLQETVATGRSFSSTLTEFNKRFKGDGEMTGKIAGYFRTTIKDMTWEIERTASETFAKTLNLQYFIHDGTLMETSREFCIERAGKVFHVSDVEKWEKNLPYFPENYDYFKHCGGYGCNHRTRWMSNATGAKLYQQKQPQSPTPPQEQPFMPAANHAEINSRMSAIGINNVNLSKMPINEANAILGAYEKKLKGVDFSKLNNITTIRTGSGKNVGAWYKPGTNEIEFNVTNIKKYPENGIPVLSWNDRLNAVDKRITELKTKYLNNPLYDQRDVNNKIRRLSNDKATINIKIKRDEKPLPFTVGSQLTKQQSIEATTIHETGHYIRKNFVKKTDYRFDYQKRPSEYAGESDEEYFAEWFTQYKMHGSENVPDDLLTIFKNLKL